jgi:hypothetical protein
VHVLGVLDQRRTTILPERGTPVDGTGTDTDGAVAALPGDLHRAVEEFLHRPRPALDPALLIEHPEVLRRLDDPNPWVALHIGKQLVEQVRARSEIGVEDEDVLP